MTTLLFDSPSQLFTIHAATPAALCSTAVVGGLAVSRTSHHDTDSSGTFRSPRRANPAESTRLQLTGTPHCPTFVKGKMTTPNLQCLLAFLRYPFHFALPPVPQKSFLNNRSASCNPSSVSTTDFALPMGSEI